MCVRSLLPLSLSSNWEHRDGGARHASRQQSVDWPSEQRCHPSPCLRRSQSLLRRHLRQEALEQNLESRLLMGRTSLFAQNRTTPCAIFMNVSDSQLFPSPVPYMLLPPSLYSHISFSNIAQRSSRGETEKHIAVGDAPNLPREGASNREHREKVRIGPRQHSPLRTFQQPGVQRFQKRHHSGSRMLWLS